MREIVVIAHDIRSTHNVGSLLRTADGLGIQKVYFTGYTPYPTQQNDSRLPHLTRKLNAQIHKTALGAEKSINWERPSDVLKLIEDLKDDDHEVIALEQAKGSIKLPNYEPTSKVAILLGSEVSGIDDSLLAQCDEVVEIPMLGKKESFNVVEAATMAMYHFRFSL